MILFDVSRPSAQPLGTASAEFFRIEWEQHETRRGPVVEGYVYNSRGLSADRVVLRVEGLDGERRVVSTTTGYVMGGVPPFGRTYFEIRVPSGATNHRIVVSSFDWVESSGASGGGM